MSSAHIIENHFDKEKNYPSERIAMPNRNFTDADIEALAEKLKEKMTDKFFKDLGKGVWKFVWLGIICVAMALAAYGSAKGK